MCVLATRALAPEKEIRSLADVQVQRAFESSEYRSHAARWAFGPAGFKIMAIHAAARNALCGAYMDSPLWRWLAVHGPEGEPQQVPRLWVNEGRSPRGELRARVRGGGFRSLSAPPAPVR